jgi:hypothetical protein
MLFFECFYQGEKKEKCGTAEAIYFLSLRHGDYFGD